MVSPPAPQIDAAIPRFNQACVAVLCAVAFLFDQSWLVVAVFGVLALSRFAGPPAALFTRLFIAVVEPRLPAGRDVVLEDARPPRFAQLLGTIFLGVASGAFVLGYPLLGWALTLMVTALAALAATTAICVGCIVYERAVLRT